MTLRVAAEPVQGLPEIEAGADLAAADRRDGCRHRAPRRRGHEPEGRLEGGGTARAALGREPLTRGAPARGRARQGAGVVQLVLDESSEVLRAARGVLITRTHHGLVCANAGVDRSNVPGDDLACLLPVDPDASARRLRGRVAGAARGRDRRQLRARVAPRPGRCRDRLRRARSPRRPPRQGRPQRS